ncbi:hypothetical protein QYE76_036909 [Lolium multiflorum]|uniref:Transposase (putative) gypsy type domain-containing protein n=1 Tax=Lolium multiflorum TaxID=4521 RepID=A0AAD8VPT7_LOLMU|nr:hypothetical protein QYE76_036909 [Lolium multiflorum]
MAPFSRDLRAVDPFTPFTPFSPLLRAPRSLFSARTGSRRSTPERALRRSVLRVLNSGEPPRGKLAAGNLDHRTRHYDVFDDSASELGTDHGDAHFLRPSSLCSHQAGSYKGFRQGDWGTSAHPEKTSEAGQSEQQTEEAAKKSKARKRDSEAKGKWWPCTTTEMELKNLESEGFLQPGSWRTVPNEPAPAPRDNEMVLTKALVERGFSFPPSDFFREILKTYGLQPHNISPNSVLAISNHVALCEGHLRVTPELSLFQYYFSVKKEKIRQTSELATCGSVTFIIRPGRVYPPTDRHESARYWSGGFFYLKDVSDPASDKKLPPFKNCPATELPSWTHCPHFSDSPQLTRAVGRICKLTEEGLTGKDLTLSWFTKRIQPLQHRDRLMFEYTGRDDPMRATKDNLSADAIDKRIRVLIKIPRELHVHVCNKDIHTEGSGTALEALEENELGTLLRVPSTGHTDPEATSRRKLLKLHVPRRGRSQPLPALTRNAPRNSQHRGYPERGGKEAPRADQYQQQGQPAIQHFFKPSGSGSQPPKAPRVIKKKAKPSPASFPITPEVEVPPKASSASKPDPKDIIDLDDLPEDPAHHGDSTQGTSSPMPPPDQPSSAFAGPTDEEQEQKAKLLQVTNATRVSLEPTPSLRKLTLAERHAEVSAMNKEIEGLREHAENSQKAIQLLETRLQEETAKHSSLDELSAKVKVLEAENESLQNFMKESSSKETEARKELSEKHAREKAELIDKLEKSQGRALSLIAKNKALEAEAEAIDKLIFRAGVHEGLAKIFSARSRLLSLATARLSSPHSTWLQRGAQESSDSASSRKLRL